MVGVGYDLQHAQKLVTQLLAESCYGAEHVFIRPVRSPPFMCFLCACVCTGVEQVILTNVKRTHKQLHNMLFYAALEAITMVTYYSCFSFVTINILFLTVIIETHERSRTSLLTAINYW